MPKQITQHHESDRRNFTLPVLIVLLVLVLLGAGVLIVNAFSSDSESEADKSEPVTTQQLESKPTSTEAKESEEQEEPDSPGAALNAGPAPQGTGSFSMTGPATISGATYDVMPFELPLNPAGPQATMVRWVDGLGAAPDKAETGTVYALGHAWAPAPLVFNPISEQVTAAVDFSQAPESINGLEQQPIRRYTTHNLDGSEITMLDAQGNGRVWKVTRSWLVDKDEAIDDPDIMAEDRPGRIILIACAVDGGQDLEYNVIVEGELV